MTNSTKISIWFDKLDVMGRVISAMILRETKTRFGRNKFGYLWAIVEPAAYIAIFLIVRSQLNARVPFGENLLLFMLSGLLTFRVFASVSGRALSAITANKAMLAYPPVKAIDVIFARIILETLTMLIMLMLFFGFLIITTATKVIVNYDSFAAAIAVLFLLSAGIGTFNAVFSVIWPAWERVWGIIRLPILLLSGIFYVPKSLPPIAQDVLWWNPIIHVVEWFRTATYVAYDPLLSKPYVIGFAVFALTLGMGLERLYRSKILSA